MDKKVSCKTNFQRSDIVLDVFFIVKLNAGRKVSGILRGYDLFMNLVLDEAIEHVSATEKTPIGMVVS
jgi:small nuclear ribonucleoprotein G